MKRRKIEVEILEADNGKLLEVYHDDETEPVYYKMIYTFCLHEFDVINEIDISTVEKKQSKRE